MKELKNYKIRTKGRNEEILAKAKDLGYTFTSNIDRNAKFYSLYSSPYPFFTVGWFDDDSRFSSSENKEISVNDFLRLNWEPKVGERVKIVGLHKDDAFYDDTERIVGTVIVISGDVLKRNGGYYSFYTDEERSYYKADIIPIYPKEKAEKPDVWILNNSAKSGYINAFQNGEPSIRMIAIPTLRNYNILSEEEYKSKYPDKLMFKEWEVKDQDRIIKVGCTEILKDHATGFLCVMPILENHCVDPREAYEWIKEHKKELGL